MTTVKTLKANSLKSAERALEAGQISRPEFKSLTDGRISKKDVEVAKSVLADARAALRGLRKEGASDRRVAKAEERVKIAKGLENAIAAQREAQTTSRPSTSSGKGSSTPVSRPSTSSGKGSSTPVSRPSTSSGKGTSRPVSRPSTSSGKGTSAPVSRPVVSRPSTSSGKGVSRPSVSSGKGSPR